MLPPQHAREELLPLLQPYTKVKSEPHPITMMFDHIFAFTGSYPDLMHLKESLIQP